MQVRALWWRTGQGYIKVSRLNQDFKAKSKCQAYLKISRFQLSKHKSTRQNFKGACDEDYNIGASTIKIVKIVLKRRQNRILQDQESKFKIWVGTPAVEGRSGVRGLWGFDVLMCYSRWLWRSIRVRFRVRVRTSVAVTFAVTVPNAVVVFIVTDPT